MKVTQVDRRAVFVLAQNIGAEGLCDLIPPLLNALQEHAGSNTEQTRRLKREWARARRAAEKEDDEGLLNGHFGDESMRD